MQYDQLVELLPLGPQGEMDLGLDSMYQLMAALNNPQDKVPTIHIAGTNGKGSTSSYVAHILREAGYRVGLFTSPSLVEFNERIQINGKAITDDQLLHYTHIIKEAIEGTELKLTEFELFTALGFLYFEDKCDIAIIEVGLGGRIDATNVIANPVVTAITKIGLDHIAILGDTLEEIAREKAEIIKPGSPVIVYPQNHTGINDIIFNKAKEQQSPLIQVSIEDLDYNLNNESVQDFKYKNVLYRISLLEEHQIINAAVALEICFALQKIGWDLNSNVIDQGLAKTVWPARFEWICKQPNVIIDGSHNEDGLHALKANLDRYFPNERRLAIVGFMKDKEVDEPLKDVIESFDVVITVTPDSPRALSAQELEHKIKTWNQTNHTQDVFASDSLEEALNRAISLATSSDLITIFGSFYFVGHIRQMILAGRNEDI